MVGFTRYLRLPTRGIGIASPPDPPVPPSGALLLPNDSRLLVSDYHQIAERSTSRLRLRRSIVDGQGYEHCAPGARVSFVTDATSVSFLVYYNDLVTRDDARNFVAEVLVDGVSAGTFTNPAGAGGPSTVLQTLTLAAGSKTVALIWPYGDGMDLLSVTLNTGSTASAAVRPAGKIVFQGDSITHGFSSSKSTQSWPYKTAALLNRQLINLGYGGRGANGSDASALTGTGADRVAYMIGFNNFYPASNLAAFQSAVESWITIARAALPAAKLYLVSPIYSTKTAADYGHTTELQAYRDRVQAAEAAAGDAETYFVDGLTVMTNNGSRLLDGIHPNDTGSGEIPAALAATIAA